MGTGKLILAFAGGVAVGVAATYRYFKNQYEKRTNDKLEAMEKSFVRKSAREPVKDRNTEAPREEMAKYTKILEGVATFIEREKKRTNHMPYQIEQKEFGEIGDYERITLRYYADGVMVDDDDDIVESPEMFVGDRYKELLMRGDAVFIRNDDKEADYEITYDERNYEDVLKERPRPRVEGEWED